MNEEDKKMPGRKKGKERLSLHTLSFPSIVTDGDGHEEAARPRTRGAVRTFRKETWVGHKKKTAQIFIKLREEANA